MEREEDDVGGNEREINDRKKQHIWWMSTKTNCITDTDYLPFQTKGQSRRSKKRGTFLCDILSSVITCRRNISQYWYPTWHPKLIISAWESWRRAQGAGSVILPNIHPLQFVYIIMSTCSAVCPLQQWLKVRPHRTRSAAADSGLCPLRNVTS